MILITDGGSTKCDWVLLDKAGDVILKTATMGLNPAVVAQEELKLRISENVALKKVSESIEKLDFYGAGCGTATPSALLNDVLTELFPNAQVKVYEDTAAAVFAATTEPGIVCILGTGSNSCYFDGREIHAPIASLGFILMDEASGNYFGKRLIRDYFYNRMPNTLASEFSEKYNLDANEIKINIYKKPNPGAYLASFARFIFNQDPPVQNNGNLNPYFHKLLKEGISTFIECRILTFDNAREVPIHFVGSIAHFSKDIIEECFREQNLKLGNIVQHPIQGLIDFYRKKYFRNIS